MPDHLTLTPRPPLTGGLFYANPLFSAQIPKSDFPPQPTPPQPFPHPRSFAFFLVITRNSRTNHPPPPQAPASPLRSNRRQQDDPVLHFPFSNAGAPPAPLFRPAPPNQKRPPACAGGPTNLSQSLSCCSSRPGSTRPLYHIPPKILPKSCQKSQPIPTHSDPFRPIPTPTHTPANPL